LKTATDTAETGRTVIKTTETRVIPTEIASERKTPEFWPYLEGLTRGDWERHLLYVYRKTAEVGPMIMLEKSSGFMAMPGGAQVELNSKEEFEFAMQQKYGGGHYHLIMKRGAERVTIGKMLIDGQPKSTQPGVFADNTNGTNPVAPTSQPAGANDVATTAMNLVANHEAEAVNVAINALRGASEVVQRFSKENAPTSSPTDDLLRQAMAAMLNKMLNPPPAPDPMESVLRMLTVIKELNAVSNPAGAQNSTLQKILDTFVERGLNPPPSGPATSTGAELVRQLPQVAGFVTDAMREWRMGMEVQRDAMLINRGATPAQLPPSGAPVASVIPPPPGPQPNPAEVQQNVTGPPLDFIEAKIIEILREPLSTEQAADEVLSFLDRLEPKLVEHLAASGEAGLFQLFQTRPILRQALTNVPRLQEFIRAFLALYGKPADAVPGAGDVGTVKPN
jgi:hypothetical protein